MWGKKHLKTSCTGKAALSRCGYSAKLILKLGHRLGSHLAHHAPTKWASSQYLEARNPQAQNLKNFPGRTAWSKRRKMLRTWALLSVGHSLQAWLDHPRIMCYWQFCLMNWSRLQWLLLMDIQLNWIEQCWDERFHISFVVSGSLLKVCFTAMEVFISHTHTQISITWQVFLKQIFFLATKSFWVTDQSYRPW